jgi:uncharacterized protein YbaP (TraB family)
LRRTLIAVVLSLAAVLAGDPAGAQTPASCGGRDLAADLRARSPDRYEAAVQRARTVFSNLDGRLWRIERPGTPPSMLFGTMHVTDPRATIPPELAAALARARVVAIELEDAIIPGPRSHALAGMMVGRALNPAGNALAPLSEDEGSFVRHHLQLRGLPLEATGAFRPWFLYLLLSLPACEMQRHAQAPATMLDARVAAARSAGTPLVSLETVDEQLDVLSGLPDDIALKAIIPTLRAMSATDDLFATMLGLYAAGQVAAAIDVALALGILAEQDRELMLSIAERLKGKRDQLMAERALPLLAEGNAVIAVGALHLPGEGGLVERLRAAGYTLTRVE